MSITPEEMRLRDEAIGAKAELNEANYQREKAELANAQLRNENEALIERHHADQLKLLEVIARRDAEITAIHQSHTWRIGFFVMAPLRWIKRSKR